MRSSLPILIVCLTVASVGVFAATDSNWAQFRGPSARGISEERALPVQWTAEENVAWKTDIPGRGWSSPVVWGNQIFLTTVINMGESEEPKKGLYMGGNRPDAPESVHQWQVYCLDLESGAVLWQKQVHEGRPPAPIHVKNSYASETPVTDGERIYAYFGNLGIWCFDLAGNEVWTKVMEPRRMAFGWGTAASPMLHGTCLYIVNDNMDDSCLLVLDKKTGEELLRIPRDESSNWSTPYLWENDLRTEIVTPGSGLVRSYSLDGTLLWSFKGMSTITIATPYAAHGLLYISSGYVGDKRRPLYAIRPGASGDISLEPGQTSNAWISWSYPKAAPYNPTSLVYGDHLYVLYDRGEFACFNAKDGAVVYERTRIPHGGNYSASPWAYDGNLFCLNEDGVTFVIKAGPAFEVVRSNPLAEDDMGMATPAIVGGRLIIRTAARVYCIKNAGAK